MCRGASGRVLGSPGYRLLIDRVSVTRAVPELQFVTPRRHPPFILRFHPRVGCGGCDTVAVAVATAAAAAAATAPYGGAAAAAGRIDGRTRARVPGVRRGRADGATRGRMVK